MKRILLIGSSNMDLSMNMYKIPSPGEVIVDDGGVAYTPGGKGANAAIAFKKLGADAAFLTRLGADVHGKKLYEQYKAIGIDTKYIKVDRDFPTGFSAILKEPSGADRVIYYPGANTHITRENIVEAFTSMPEALCVDFEVSFDAALIASRMAAERDIPIFIDASPASKEQSLELLPKIEIFSLNEAETYEYTGVMPAGADSSLRAALSLWKRIECKYLVIKQGPRGAFIYDGKHYVMIPAYRADKIVDTRGSGDAFGAAMINEYIETKDIVRAVKYGCAAGAIASSREGALFSSPTKSELESFLNKQDFFR